MNLKDHTVPVRHHLTFTCADPRWNSEELAEYIADLCRDNSSEGLDIFVSPFDENQELVELRRTVDEAFRVIGTGAIHLLQQGDGWERFRALMAALKAFVEQGEQFSSSAHEQAYREGEEDGFGVAIQRLEALIKKFEEK